jgi:hypothetical protein
LRYNKIVLDKHLNYLYNIHITKEKDMDLWTTLKHLEKEHNCIIYGVLEPQGVVNDLGYWAEFDCYQADSGVFLIDAYDIPTDVLLQAMKYAYNTEGTSGDRDCYNAMVTATGEWLIDEYKTQQCVCGEINCNEQYAHTTSGV